MLNSHRIRIRGIIYCRQTGHNSWSLRLNEIVLPRIVTQFLIHSRSFTRSHCSSRMAHYYLITVEWVDLVNACWILGKECKGAWANNSDQMSKSLSFTKSGIIASVSSGSGYLAQLHSLWRSHHHHQRFWLWYGDRFSRLYCSDSDGNHWTQRQTYSHPRARRWVLSSSSMIVTLPLQFTTRSNQINQPDRKSGTLLDSCYSQGLPFNQLSCGFSLLVAHLQRKDTD